MNKYLSILFAAALFASCAKDIAPENEGFPVFKAGFENGFETKTYLNESLLNRWNADDRVSIFVGNTYNQQYKFEGKTGANSGSFSQVENPGFFSGAKLEANYSVYPYSENTSISEEGVVSFEFPSVQSYEPNSFGVGANTMVAVTENTSDMFLLFKNICGYLKVSLYGDAVIKSVSVQGNGGEIIAGEGTVTASSSDVPSVTMSASGGNVVSIDCGEGVQLEALSETATDFYFVIPPVKFSQGITITAVGVDGKVFEKSTKASFSILRNKIQRLPAAKYEGVRKGNITFADANFKAYCVENFDTNGDGEISYAEAGAVTKIDCDYKSISAMDEIRFFTSLTDLRCDGNQLTSLDVSNCLSLRSLNCARNNLADLDVSKNVELTRLECGDNNIISLDLIQNTSLSFLECSRNLLSKLDISQNTELTFLGCSDNQFASLNVSHNAVLGQLYCSGNKLTVLDISNNLSLVRLYCSFNQLSNLDVSRNSALVELVCYENQLTNLDLSQNTYLRDLNCHHNLLSRLDLSQNTSLVLIICNNNPYLTEIWLRTGQSTTNFYYDKSVAEVKYK